MLFSTVTEAKRKTQLEKQRLTWKGAKVVVVVTAALAENAVLVTSATWDLIVEGLVTSVPAGRFWDN